MDKSEQNSGNFSVSLAKFSKKNQSFTVLNKKFAKFLEVKDIL
jgi:hypothetical protein